jgi:hypothetical protein
MACERVLCVPRSATSCGGADGDGGGGPRVLRLQARRRQGQGDDRRFRQCAVTLRAIVAYYAALVHLPTTTRVLL